MARMNSAIDNLIKFLSESFDIQRDIPEDLVLHSCAVRFDGTYKLPMMNERRWKRLSDCTVFYLLGR
jgi:hypothetical protein